MTLVLISHCKKEVEPRVNIPDNNFLNALINLGVDKNRDGKISSEEAEMITSLNLIMDTISDMEGIQAFHNLDTLYCDWNEMTSLDVTNNTALIVLTCINNQLTSLDISKNTLLNHLECSSN